MAGALASMLRNAGGTMTTVAHSKEEYAQYIEGITDVMSYLGIDTSKDFTVNGMKYSKNKDGWYESEANSEAQTAYEQLKANNRVKSSDTFTISIRPFTLATFKALRMFSSETLK